MFIISIIVIIIIMCVSMWVRVRVGQKQESRRREGGGRREEGGGMEEEEERAEWGGVKEVEVRFGVSLFPALFIVFKLTIDF